jgi:PAS domain S-box-containing protein
MDAIISVDEAQRIVLYNRAAERIFGWSAADMLGGPLDRLLPQRYRRGHGDLVRHFGDTGATSRRMGGAVLLGLRHDGEEFPIEATISQLDTPAGKLFTVILRDVTERLRAQEEMAAFAAEASGIREQEKSRVARELHDELAQTLTALKMDCTWVRDHVADPAAAVARLAGMQDLLDQAVAATRRIAADLRPLVLDDLGLIAGIQWLGSTFQQRHGVPCELELDESLDLPEPYATGLFRIVQESLANVAKHAQATQAVVRLARTHREVVLSVEDDGRGFRLGQARGPQSLGLVGLRERARLLRGSLAVASEPGKGTRVETRIPLAPGDV